MKSRRLFSSRLPLLLGALFLALGADLRAEVALRGIERFSPSTRAPEPYLNSKANAGIFEATLNAVDAHSKKIEKVWTLPALVDEALRRNPATTQFWHIARAAAADVRVAQSYYFPTVSFGVQAGPQYQSTPLYPGSIELQGAQISPYLDVQWLLLDFGGRAAGMEASRFRLLGRNFDYNQALQNVTLNVMTSYYNLEGTRSTLADAEASLALARATLESSDRREKAGLGNITDVLQARQNAAQALFNLENVRGNLSVAEVNLATAVGFPGSTRLVVAPPAGKPSLALLQEKMDRLIDRALRQRPDVAAKYSAWREQLAVSRQAEANIWPVITSSVRLQRTFYYSDTRESEFSFNEGFNGTGDFDNASAYLTFSVDLFDGGRKINAARSAKLLADAARADFIKSELSAIANVAASFVTFRSASQRVEAAQALLAASEKSFDSTNASYRAGLRNIIDLLTAQSALAMARTTLSQARTDLFVAAATLSNAAGLLQPTPQGRAPAFVTTNGANTSNPAR